MENQQKPLNIRVGCEVAIFKVTEFCEHDMTSLLTTDYHEETIDEIVGTPITAILEDEDRALQGYRHIFINLNVSTENMSVYTPETMKYSVCSLETELYTIVQTNSEKVKGSAW